MASRKGSRDAPGMKGERARTSGSVSSYDSTLLTAGSGFQIPPQEPDVGKSENPAPVNTEGRNLNASGSIAAQSRNLPGRP